MKKKEVSAYFSIITPNINGLSLQLKDTDWPNGVQKDPVVCCLQDTRLTSRHTQIEIKRKENEIPRKQNLKASRRSYSHI
jgi:exonuclease III